MRRVGIDPVDTPRRDDLQRRPAFIPHGVLHVVHLHRRGMRAQHVLIVDIKSVVHGTGRMVFRNVERREIVEIGFNLRAFRHFETDGMEYLFESIHGQRDRMQATRARTTRRQGDIDSLAGELLRLLGIQDGVTSGFQGIFNPLLDDIDGGTGSRTLFSAQLAQAF